MGRQVKWLKLYCCIWDARQFIVMRLSCLTGSCCMLDFFHHSPLFYLCFLPPVCVAYYCILAGRLWGLKRIIVLFVWVLMCLRLLSGKRLWEFSSQWEVLSNSEMSLVCTATNIALHTKNAGKVTLKWAKQCSLSGYWFEASWHVMLTLE